MNTINKCYFFILNQFNIYYIHISYEIYVSIYFLFISHLFIYYYFYNNIKQYLNDNIYYLGITFLNGIFIVNIYLEYFCQIFVPAVMAFSVTYNLMKCMLNRP